MGQIGCVRCEKSQHDFVARTFALIASSLCFASSFMQLWNDRKCTQPICNAPKHEFRVQWGGLGAFVEKIATWHLGKNFRINCTRSHCFASSCIQLRNDPKCTQTLCDAPKHEFRVQWSGLVRSLQKIPTWLRGTDFCINCTSSPNFA